jgi:hypothetical protein
VELSADSVLSHFADRVERRIIVGQLDIGDDDEEFSRVQVGGITVATRRNFPPA